MRTKLERRYLEKTESIIFWLYRQDKSFYFTSDLQEVMRFEMLGHQIQEENGMIKIIDDTDNGAFTKKTVIINPSVVESVTCENDKSDDAIVYRRKVIVRMDDQSLIELSTSAIG